MIKMEYQSFRLIAMHTLAAWVMVLGCETSLLQKTAQPENALFIQMGVMLP